MVNLALLDLVLPYVFRGENIGPAHAALSVLRVVEYETASDEFGVALRDHSEVNGSLDFFPGSGQLIAGNADEAAPAHDPPRSEPIFDLRDTSIDFELFVPRQPSAIVTQGQAQTNASPATAVLAELAPTSDYPTTGGLGRCTPVWAGPTDTSVLPETEDKTDPSGRVGPGLLTTLSGLIP